jgi:hypothetical protein
MTVLSRPSRCRRALLLLCASLLGMGCRTLPDTPGRHAQEIYHGQLEIIQPADVVIAPLIDKSGGNHVPDLMLREAFQRNLIKRRYSALALPYTDSRVVNASYQPGALSEDAILQVTVHEWNMDRWKSNKEVRVNVEAWMLSGGGDTQLWGGRFEKTFYLEREMSNRPTEKGAFEATTEIIAAELLEIMPARTPKP